jgi:hypothetical protein
MDTTILTLVKAILEVEPTMSQNEAIAYALTSMGLRDGLTIHQVLRG